MLLSSWELSGHGGTFSELSVLCQEKYRACPQTLSGIINVQSPADLPDLQPACIFFHNDQKGQEVIDELLPLAYAKICWQHLA